MIKQILKRPVKFITYSVIAYFFCKIKNDDKKLKDQAYIVGAKIDKITAAKCGEKRSEKIQCLLIQIVLSFCNHLVDYLMQDMPKKMQDDIKDRRRVI